MNITRTNHGAPVELKRIEALFILPTPPPGIEWHRKTGWQEGDLPEGMRPLAFDEPQKEGDEYRAPSDWRMIDAAVVGDPSRDFCLKRRTRRPLNFTHAGKTWTWHRPGDPMPCDTDKRIHYLMVGDADCAPRSSTSPAYASDLRWNQANLAGDIIGWRYADEKKTVPLGPEDVRCGDEIQHERDTARAILKVMPIGVEVFGLGFKSFEELQHGIFKIRRRNSDALEPCSKEIDA